MSAQMVIKHTPSQGRGVSLAKGTDRPSGVVMVPSAWELGRRACERIDLDSSLPLGALSDLDANDPHALGFAFAWLAKFRA